MKEDDYRRRRVELALEVRRKIVAVREVVWFRDESLMVKLGIDIVDT